jgi:hypothetical protein
VPISGYSINGYWWAILLMAIRSYFIGGYMVILLMVISGYYIGGYWWLLMVIILVAINEYSISGY